MSRLNHSHSTLTRMGRTHHHDVVSGDPHEKRPVCVAACQYKQSLTGDVTALAASLQVEK